MDSLQEFSSFRDWNAPYCPLRCGEVSTGLFLRYRLQRQRRHRLKQYLEALPSNQLLSLAHSVRRQLPGACFWYVNVAKLNLRLLHPPSVYGTGTRVSGFTEK